MNACAASCLLQRDRAMHAMNAFAAKKMVPAFVQALTRLTATVEQEGSIPVVSIAWALVCAPRTARGFTLRPMSSASAQLCPTSF
jgi:hypothetical protein